MYRHKPRIVKQSPVVGSEKMAIEKRWEDCYNRSWRSKCYCVGGLFSCIGAWVSASRPCPALLFASLLLSYHVFHALTSSFFQISNFPPRPTAFADCRARLFTEIQPSAALIIIFFIKNIFCIAQKNGSRMVSNVENGLHLQKMVAKLSSIRYNTEKMKKLLTA